MSWEELTSLGARASRPHKAWHSFAYLPHFDQPGTAPLLSFQLADAVSADRVASCRIALKLSGRQAANAAGCLQRRWPGWRREASLGSQAHPGGEPRSRGLGAVGQGLAGEGALAGTGCGRDARAPRGCHPAARRGGSGGRLLKNLTCTQAASSCRRRRQPMVEFDGNPVTPGSNL